MGRQVIAKTTCAFCRRSFDIATEDIEWEHISDCGETDENPELKDFSIHQKIHCPWCKKDNEILITMKGKEVADLDITSVQVINLSEIKN